MPVLVATYKNTVTQRNKIKKKNSQMVENPVLTQSPIVQFLGPHPWPCICGHAVLSLAWAGFSPVSINLVSYGPNHLGWGSKKKRGKIICSI